MRLDRAEEDRTSKEGKMQAFESEHEVAVLQQKLSDLRGDGERGSAKKMRAGGGGSKDAAIVDLTLSSDDESEGEAGGAAGKTAAVVAQVCRREPCIAQNGALIPRKRALCMQKSPVFPEIGPTDRCWPQARQIDTDEVLEHDTVIQAVAVPVGGSAGHGAAGAAAPATLHGGDGGGDREGGGEEGPSKRAKH